MALTNYFSKIVPHERRLRAAIALFEDEERAFEGFARLSRLASEGIVEAQYQVGRGYLEGRGTPYQFREGERWMRRAAEARHREACYLLAMLFTIGYPKGFDAAHNDVFVATVDEERVPDLEGALPWALAAAEMGHVEASGLLGYLYSSGPPSIADDQKAIEWYKIADERGSPQGSLGLALATLREKPDAQAIALLQKAADAGLPTAFFYLGWVYEAGSGVEADQKRAAQAYEKAAEGGLAPAALRFAVCLIHGRGVQKDLFRAETWLRRAAFKGEAEAGAILGDLSIRGFDHAPNYEDAAKWYQLAAELGHPAAARGMGLLYLMGAGVPRDAERSAQWFHASAEKGDTIANADFGNLALSGLGTEEQKATLFARFEEAAKKGDLMAAFNLGVCLARGVGVQRDPEAALRWMTIAADGVVNAQYWLGRLYSGEMGVPPDMHLAVIWFEKAVQANLPEAQVALAQLLVTGDSFMGRDHPRALELYKAAAGKGLADGMFGLGAMLGGGHDVEGMNRAEAQSWFRRAAERGHGLAQLMLGRYLERGLGGEVNFDEALLWYERAEKAGVAGASNAYKTLRQSLVENVD